MGRRIEETTLCGQLPLGDAALDGRALSRHGLNRQPGADRQGPALHRSQTPAAATPLQRRHVESPAVVRHLKHDEPAIPHQADVDL